MATEEYLNVGIMKTQLKQKFFEFCETSSSHGIPNIARSNNWFIRIMWILFFLTSFGYCLSIIITSIINFLAYEVTISVTRVHEQPAPFPAVTVCNVNPFVEPLLFDFISSSNESTNAYSCLTNQPGSSSLNCSISDAYKTLDAFVDKIKHVVAESVRLNSSLSPLTGLNFFTEMKIGCSFNLDKCNDLHILTRWSEQYGNCYTFNSGQTEEIKQTSSTGQGLGLQIELLVAYPFDSFFTYKTGLYLFVHNQSSPIYTLNNPINIQTGYETYVGVNRVFTNRLGGQYSKCRQDFSTSSSENAYTKKMMGFFKLLGVQNYDQNSCFKICYQDKLIDKCNCSDILIPAIRNTGYCSLDVELGCLNEFAIQFRKANINEFCEFACAEECNNVEYNTQPSLSNYPTSSYLTTLYQQNPTLFSYIYNESELVPYAKKALVRLVINYDNLYYTSIQESPKTTIEDLLGNLGGQLGLFIGISFLSVVEVLELVSEFLIIYLRNRKQAKIVFNK